jgi:uncharacterized membrane protein
VHYYHVYTCTTKDIYNSTIDNSTKSCNRFRGVEMKKLIIASLVIAALAAGGVVSAFSHSYYAGESGEGRRAGCIGDQLTEEQREALSQLMQELKDAGATPEEIREAVQQFLEEQGIDTEDCQGTMGPKRGQHGN